MAENRFEKTIHDQMAEFKLQPSGTVWTKVEEKIRARKKKRRALFLIVFSLIGISLAGYEMFTYSTNHNNHQTAIVIDPPATETTKKPQEPGVNIPKDSEKIYDQQNIPAINNPVALKQKARGVYDHPTDKIKRGDNGISIQGNQNNILAGKSQVSAPAAKSKKDHLVAVETKGEMKPPAMENVYVDTRVDSLKKSNPPLNNQQLSERQLTSDVASTRPVDTANVMKEPLKENVSAAPVKKQSGDKQVTRKISWGFNLSTGVSGIRGDRFSFKSNSSADRFYNSPVTAPGGPVAGRAPSQNKNAFAYEAGLSARKNLTPRSSLVVELNYAYLADRIKIASVQIANQQNNNLAVATYYYNSIPEQTYTDRFHFIELPVTYDWRVTRNQHHFLALDAGVSIGYLLATNALIYDTTSGGIYYRDKSMFTKTHVNLLAGLSYHFTKGLDFSLGPQFSFDLNKFSRSDLDNRKYFLYSALSARIFFGKKK